MPTRACTPRCAGLQKAHAALDVLSDVVARHIEAPQHTHRRAEAGAGKVLVFVNSLDLIARHQCAYLIAPGQSQTTERIPLRGRPGEVFIALAVVVLNCSTVARHEILGECITAVGSPTYFGPSILRRKVYEVVVAKAHHLQLCLTVSGQGCMHKQPESFAVIHILHLGHTIVIVVGKLV